VLQALGQELQQGIRKSDVACRCGEWSFAVLLPETPAPGSQVIRQRLETHLQATLHEKCPSFTLTLSTQSREEAETCEAFLDRVLSTRNLSPGEQTPEK
jgi:GGDEF domain-containing protein